MRAVRFFVCDLVLRARWIMLDFLTLLRKFPTTFVELSPSLRVTSIINIIIVVVIVFLGNL
jgi:hypothetical protein